MEKPRDPDPSDAPEAEEVVPPSAAEEAASEGAVAQGVVDHNPPV